MRLNLWGGPSWFVVPCSWFFVIFETKSYLLFNQERSTKNQELRTKNQKLRTKNKKTAAPPLPMPDVSIIIPNYNGARFLREAVDSALAQAVDGLEVEVIVVDDGSTDDSLKILHAYEDKIRLFQQPHQGACAARNKGWRAATAPSIKFLDADDRLLPEALIREWAWKKENTPGEPHRIPFSDARMIDAQGRCLRDRYLGSTRLAGPISASALVRRAPLTTMPLFPRAALEAISGFDPHMPAAQEYDLQVRMQFSGWRFLPLDFVGYEHRIYPSTARVSRRPLSARNFRYRFDAYVRHLDLAASHLEGEGSAELAAAFAGIFWSTGRFALRCGQPQSAALFFDRARSLSSSVPFGNPVYRCLCRWFGPRSAERLSGSFNKLRNRVRL